MSLNETGESTVPRMESLTGRHASELQDELGSWSYRDPEGGDWQPAVRYLSGNVRAKLAAAEIAAQIDPSCYQRNVGSAAVRPAQGPRTGRDRSAASAPPGFRERTFATSCEVLDVPRIVGVESDTPMSIATWTVDLDYSAKYVVNTARLTARHGSPRRTG